MLSQMPSPPPADVEEAVAANEMPANVPYVQSDTATAGLLAAPESAAPEDVEVVSTAVGVPISGPVNWETVVGHVQAHKADVGTALLSDYFGVDVAKAARCTQTFQEKVQQTPEILASAMRLGLEVRRGSVNSSIMLFWECFGLQGTEAIAAMQTLKARLASTT
jgi:hypothetical protein